MHDSAGRVMLLGEKAKISFALIALYALYTILFTPVILYLAHAAEPLSEMGIRGVLFYAVLFVILAALMVPSSFMKLVAGALFGFGWGALAGGLGAYFGALVPFFLIRKLGARRLVEPHLTKPIWRAVDEASHEHGRAITILIRLSLVLPYNFSNYILGATDIRSRDYALGNLATFGPTLLYAWWGAALGDVASAAVGGPQRDTLWWVTMLGSLVLTIAGAFWMQRLTGRRLEQILSNIENEKHEQNSGASI